MPHVSSWDRPGIAQEIDGYWVQAAETDFRRKIASDVCGRLQPGDVLEVGCGSGRMYAALQEAGCLAGRSYRGVDSSRELLKIARRHYKGATFVAQDLFDLSDQADNVLCIQVLQHLEDWRPALDKLLAATRKWLYVVSWFGTPTQTYNSQTGFWSNWLDAKEFAERCRPYGQVTRREFENTVSAFEVRIA